MRRNRACLLVAGVAAAAIAVSAQSVPEAIGAVDFPHEFHTEDLEIECAECHHETNAEALRFPHQDYFEDFWIDCRVCHQPEGAATGARNCTDCHHQAPADFADQTLSAKVVIHKRCWACHEVGTGKTASQTCGDCHRQKGGGDGS